MARNDIGMTYVIRAACLAPASRTLGPHAEGSLAGRLRCGVEQPQRGCRRPSRNSGLGRSIRMASGCWPVPFAAKARYGLLIMSASIDPSAATARDASNFAGGIAALGEGNLYALQNPFVLDGRVSAYAASARGFSVANSYLLTESDAALLIDTGFGKDEP